MLIESQWQLTLGNPPGGGIVLLDFDDLTEAEPRVSRGVQNDVSRPLRAQYARQLRGYNVELHMPVTRVQVFDTDAEARAAMDDLIASLPYGDPLDAIKTDRNGNVSVLTGALIESGAEIVTENNRLITRLTLAGSGWTVNASPLAMTLPLVRHADIDPLVIPAGRTARVPVGYDQFCHDLQLDGALTVDGELRLIGV